MAVYDAPQPIVADEPMEESKSSSSSKKKKQKHTTTASSSSSSSSLLRYIYYKSHFTAAGADDGLKPDCTLFLVNIPFHYTSEHLTQLFTCFGTVENVAFLQAHSVASSLNYTHAYGATELSSYYRSAHVIYEESESVDIACATDLSRTPQQCPEESADNAHQGTHRWLSVYHSAHPQVASLQLQVDKFMEGFDQRTAEEKAAARSGQQTDADGWTLVKGTSRGKKRSMIEVEEETERAQEKATKKQKAQQVVHFYKHQEREQKKERLIELREKFEQDKLKIAKMKQERKFKPY